MNDPSEHPENRLRLHLATEEEVNELKKRIELAQLSPQLTVLVLTESECIALWNWLKNEHIPHNDDYELLSNLMTRINEQLVR